MKESCPKNGYHWKEFGIYLEDDEKSQELWKRASDWECNYIKIQSDVNLGFLEWGQQTVVLTMYSQWKKTLLS